MKDDKIYVEHILQSINRINSYIAGKDYKSFTNDFLTQDAVVRQAAKPDPGLSLAQKVYH
jgi:uncharacterized protein with HEPN domain